MLVGIATFNRSINNGSVLQAWAMQQTLKEIYFDSEIINYKPRHYDQLYSYFDSCKSVKSLARNIAKLIYYPIIRKQKSDYEYFRKNHLIESNEEYFYDSNLEKLNDNYDVIICGSDQIWNIRIKDSDLFYFLPITHKAKKIAFAVSINNADFTTSMEHLHWIKDFDYISLREKVGAEHLGSLLPGIDIDVMPDPTLLIKKSQFETLVGSRIINEPYIFMYCVAYRKTTLEAAKSLSQKMNMPVFTMISGKSLSTYFMVTKKGFRVIKFRNGPIDFVNYIHNADLIISNSFHGVAFSIIMEKKFVAINDSENGSLRNDKRIMNVLQEFNLQERYITLENAENYDLTEAIDYGVITKKRLMKAESIKRKLKNLICEDKI